MKECIHQAVCRYKPREHTQLYICESAPECFFYNKEFTHHPKKPHTGSITNKDIAAGHSFTEKSFNKYKFKGYPWPAASNFPKYSKPSEFLALMKEIDVLHNIRVDKGELTKHAFRIFGVRPAFNPREWSKAAKLNLKETLCLNI